MSLEDQDLKDRVARLEKELAEIKLLLTPKPELDPWAPRERPSIEPNPKPAQPPASPKAVVREPLRTFATPPPVVPSTPKTDPEPVQTFAQKPRASEPDQVRIKPQASRDPEPPVTDGQSGRTRSEDVEFKIGGHYLAYAGGIVVLLGMLYLVTLLISNRWITMEMQWGGELVFCAILAGLGLWKLNDKEAVGQVLVGTGSCGAFLSFAGAHVFKGILSLDALIAACLCLSLLNFAFSEWRKSQIFYVFGMLGGFIASALPPPDRVALSQILQAVVIIPAVIVVVRRKWMGMAYLLWPTAVGFGLDTLSQIDGANYSLNSLNPASALGTLPRGAPFSWGYWGVFSLFGLAVSAAYLRVHKPDPLEQGPVLAWVGPSLFTVLPFALLPELAKPWGFVATLAVCLAHLALARLAASEESKRGQMLGAITAGLIVPAFSLTFAQASGVYAIEACALAIWWLRSKEASVYGLAVTTGMLGWIASLPALFETHRPGATPWDQFLSTAPSLAIAVAAAVFIVRTADFYTVNTRSFLFFCSAAALSRGLVQLFISLKLPDAGPFAWSMLATLALLAVASWFDKTKDAVAGQIVFTLLGLLGVLFSLGERTPQHNEVIQNSILLASVILSAAAYAKVDAKKAAQGAIFASLAAIYPFAKLVYLASINLGADNRSALLIGLTLFTLVVSAVAKWQKWKDLASAAGIYACAVIIPYSSRFGDGKASAFTLSAGYETVGLAALMATIVLIAINFIQQLPKEKEAATVFGILAFSIPAARLAWIIMSQPWLQLQLAQAMLLFFALYASVLALFGKSKAATGVSWTSSFYLALGLACYPVMKMPATFNVEMPYLIGGANADAATLASLLAASLMVCRALLAQTKNQNSVLVTFIGLNWALFSGLLMILAQQPPLRIKFDFSMSAAWVLYGVILLVIGFIQDKAIYRISGLVVFSATLCKVFLYDLSYLETVIKVILFISFGVVMLAISYAYTMFSKTQRKTDSPS